MKVVLNILMFAGFIITGVLVLNILVNDKTADQERSGEHDIDAIGEFHNVGRHAFLCCEI